MRTTADKRKGIELKGIDEKTFKIVKKGLDENEVFSYISELTKENKELQKKLEHLSALTQLAKSTVVEAEKYAKSIMMQTEEKAKSKAASIINDAEQQARLEGEKIVAESRQQAEEIAQKRISLAEQQAEETIRNSESRAIEVKNVAEEEASKIVNVATQNAKQEALLIAQQANHLLIRSRRIAEREIAEKFKKVCEELISSVIDIEDDK